MADTDLTNYEDVQSTGRGSTMFGLLIFALVILLYLIFTKPLSANLSIMKADLVSTTSTRETLTAKLDKFKADESELDLSSEVQILQAQRAVPLGMNQDDVIRDVISVTKANGVTLNSISFGKSGSSKVGDVSVLLVNAGFYGSFSDLLNFLKAVETNPRLFIIKNITVQLSNNSLLASKNATFNLNMETYYQ